MRRAGLSASAELLVDDTASTITNSTMSVTLLLPSSALTQLLEEHICPVKNLDSAIHKGS